MPYLTPNTNPTDTVCRVLFIPNSSEWLAIVNGALQELTYSYNFEQFGSVTPQQCVSRFMDMVDCVAFGCRGCHMVGEIVEYAGSVSPSANWLLCDGSSLLRADYSELFAVIGTVFGSVDSSHFNIPDLRGRVSIGVGQGLGLTNRNLGDNGGEETHTLTTAETPSHTHSDSGHSHTEGNASATLIAIGAGVPAASAIPSLGVTGTGFANLSSSGSGGAHNNLQPYIATNKYIVAR